MFDLNSYDCIGFDLDNTLVEYNESELVTLTYNILASYMVSDLNYDSKHLLKPIFDDIDFLRKGLTIDTLKGNVVSLGHDGTVLRACHGTRPLSNIEVMQIYGVDRKWDLGETHCNDLMTTWNGDVSQKIRSHLDYFDMCVPLIFARAVDSVDESQNSMDSYNIWSDIQTALVHMYRIENFSEHAGGYYNTVKENPSKFLRKRPNEFVKWLSTIKTSNKITFLITGSNYDYGDFIAANILGTDWKKYFDVIIYFAKKPGFFVLQRNFLDVNSGTVVGSDELKMGASYLEGNWKDLQQLFVRKLNKDDPKCIYIGDNLIQDIYAPAKYNCCDTVAVVKELAKYDGLEKRLFSSKMWGSVLFDELSKKNTIWGQLLKSYSTHCVPTVESFLKKNEDKNDT